MSGAAPTPLGAAPIGASASITDHPDFLALPASPAVVLIEAPGGRTILIATTADARDLARKRLAPMDPAQPRSARVDYHALARGGTVHTIPVGSSLEADAVYMHQARARLPHLAQIVAERRRAWFVHVDPEAEFPYWSKTNLLGLVQPRGASSPVASHSLSHPVLLGPLPDKDAAGRLIEAVIDAFDLCRFHNLLVQAPNAAACVYKEMGRCPAPCDGTENMSDYRERTREAVEALTSGTLADRIAALEEKMREAAAAANFEQADKLKKLAARLGTLDKPAFAHLHQMSTWRELILLPSTARGHIRSALFHAGSLLVLDDIDATDPKRAAATVVSSLSLSALRPAPSTLLSSDLVDTIGLYTKWLFTPRKKCSGVSIRLAPDSSPDSMMLVKAIKAVAYPKGTTTDFDALEVESDPSTVSG